jgi:hypothetical protein
MVERSGVNVPCMTLASSLHRCMVGKGSTSQLSGLRETERGALINAQGSRYTAPGEQATINTNEGSWRYIQTNGIGYSTTPRIDDVMEKLYCTTANGVFGSLEQTLMAARGQDALGAMGNATKIRNMTT